MHKLSFIFSKKKLFSKYLYQVLQNQVVSTLLSFMIPCNYEFNLISNCFINSIFIYFNHGSMNLIFFNKRKKYWNSFRSMQSLIPGHFGFRIARLMELPTLEEMKCVGEQDRICDWIWPRISQVNYINDY